MSDKHYNDDEMLQITTSVFNILDTWKFTGHEIIAVLGMDEKTKPRHLQGYRNKTKALPQTQNTLARIEHIAGISAALNTMYPMNQTSRYDWLRKPHRRFNQQTPLHILKQNINGLQAVRMEVDCGYSWSMT